MAIPVENITFFLVSATARSKDVLETSIDAILYVSTPIFSRISMLSSSKAVEKNLCLLHQHAVSMMKIPHVITRNF